MHPCDRWRVVLVTLLASLAVAGAVQAQRIQPPRLTFHAHELPNGLRVLLAPDPARPIVNFQVWYHVGSKDERNGRTGFAHLFEHLMFRGSRNVGPEEHMRYIRDAGGAVNAYTSFDQTVYWDTVPSNHLERVIWLEADRMDSLAITEENFRKEREVVKEERRMRFENPPYGLVAETLLDMAFERYPYKHLPIGSMDDLNAATLADVKAFFDTFYVPNNATLVLVGDFDPAQALGWVTQYFGRIARGGQVPRVSVSEPPHTSLREATKSWPNTPLPAVFRAWKFPPLGHPDAYAMQIAIDILSTGESSRLYRRLVYEQQLAVQASGQTLVNEGPSIFFGVAIASPGTDMKEVIAAFDEVIDQMRKAPVGADELDKAKNTVIARLVTERQSVQQKADALGLAAVLLGEAERYNTELQSFQRVTLDEVRRVMQEYVTPQGETRVIALPASR